MQAFNEIEKQLFCLLIYDSLVDFKLRHATAIAIVTYMFLQLYRTSTKMVFAILKTLLKILQPLLKTSQREHLSLRLQLNYPVTIHSLYSSYHQSHNRYIEAFTSHHRIPSNHILTAPSKSNNSKQAYTQEAPHGPTKLLRVSPRIMDKA